MNELKNQLNKKIDSSSYDFILGIFKKYQDALDNMFENLRSEKIKANQNTNRIEKIISVDIQKLKQGYDKNAEGIRNFAITFDNLKNVSDNFITKEHFADFANNLHEEIIQK